MLRVAGFDFDTRRGRADDPRLRMQRIYPCELTPEEYVETEGQRQVRPELVCPRSRQPGRLHRHGVYPRGITTSLGRIVTIWIARFCCVACRRTVSYLPSFALSYRLVRVATLEAFLAGEWSRRDVRSWEAVLKNYRRRMAMYAAQLVRTIGCAYGRAPPAESLWSWLSKACGGLDSATRRLVTDFGITLFQRYQCHQPNAVLKHRVRPG